ncbi:MAG: amino acid decarboxylase [Candidatus Chloroheliales bacterium]|nr:MAG: amino acid decarboxylase [Chloroflexota bacterium]
MDLPELEREESLDPDDWAVMRELGHRMVDDMMNYLATVRERPVWQPIPAEVKAQFKQPMPQEAQGAEQAYAEFLDQILPYPLGNIHPRFWGWVIGTGTPLGALSEMLAATMNPNVGGGEHIANYVEAQVLDWCKQMLGYPIAASGILVSGGSMANLVGLTVARNTKGFDIRELGLQAAPRKLVLYGSVEMHSSVQKAVELLGLGNEALRKMPVNTHFEIDVDALEAAIAADKAAGHQPFCIVGNAGTVNTGAMDDLNHLADICQRDGLWFHVDGAFGALAALSPRLRPRLAGMERADSLAFDLHKWMYMPYEVGCILVRNEEAHRRTFSLTPAYLAHDQRGIAAGSLWFSDYGIQLSRGFRALKVWMSIKEHGLNKYARMIEQNVAQCRYLALLIETQPELELLAPVALNIVCFRFVAPGFSDEQLNMLNKELMIRLQEAGIAGPSSTTLNGRFAIRVANTNQRSRREDFDLLVREVLRIGNKLAQGLTLNDD